MASSSSPGQPSAAPRMPGGDSRPPGVSTRISLCAWRPSAQYLQPRVRTPRARMAGSSDERVSCEQPVGNTDVARHWQLVVIMKQSDTKRILELLTQLTEAVGVPPPGPPPGAPKASLSDRLGNLDDRVGKLDDRVGGLSDSVAKLDDRVGKLDDRVSEVQLGLATLAVTHEAALRLGRRAVYRRARRHRVDSCPARGSRLAASTAS